MHKLERLIQELPSNPRVMKEIESEVDIIVQSPTCEPLYELQASKVPSVHIFVCKILEMRIRNKVHVQDLTEEIQFCTQLLCSKPSYQLCEVYSILGLYCWPVSMPGFMDTVISLLSSETGYQILLSFLEKVNANTSIDEKRRSELKKSVGLVYTHIESAFTDRFAEFIIPIFTELLKILPKNFNFSLVFEKAAECPEAVISFIVEGFPFIDQNKIVAVLKSLPVDSSLVQTLASIKISKIEEPNKVFEYVFRAISSEQESFVQAIDFWQKVFSSKIYSTFVETVLTEILKNYLKIEEDSREDVDQRIFGLFSILCKNYPENIAVFLKINGEMIPQRITANFIQKLAKADDSDRLLYSLNFTTPYLSCLTAFLRNDPAVPNLLISLDFTDKESVKLALQILEKYTFTPEQLMFILKMCENSCLNANEIKVECYLKLGIHEKFGANWAMDDVIKYFYYLKKHPGEYVQYKDYFYSLFIRNAPFDRCFSIIEKLNSKSDGSTGIPGIILQDIYDKMDKYPYIDLCCFNNDLLIYLDNPKPFIEREVFRVVSDWNTITDHKDYYQAIKSLLTVFSAKLDTIPVADSLLDLIQIDTGLILNKVLSIFNNYKGGYNVNKAVYYLISAYNNPNVTDSQIIVSSSLTECLYREEGPMAFHSILGLDISRCIEVRQQILKVNKKIGQNMVRDLIKDFKGKTFSRMYENELKVTKQNFLPAKNKEVNDYTLKEVNFI